MLADLVHQAPNVPKALSMFVMQGANRQQAKLCVLLLRRPVTINGSLSPEVPDADRKLLENIGALQLATHQTHTYLFISFRTAPWMAASPGSTPSRYGDNLTLSL